MASRKVSFFHLALSSKNNPNNFIDPTAVKTYFSSIYDSIEHKSDAAGQSKKALHAKLIPNENSDIVVEVIDFNSQQNYAFLKIGYLNTSANADLRDLETFQTQAITLEGMQKVEIYTCCYIDFTTNIVSYIGVMSAPRISALASFFDVCLQNAGIICKISSILYSTHDLDLADKRITSLEVTLAVPGTQVLANDLSMSAASFNKLMNVQSISKTIKITPPRKMSIFNDSDDFYGTTDEIFNKYQHNIKKMTATVKAEGEDAQIIDLLQVKYTRKSSITIDDQYALDDMHTLTQLSDCYWNEQETLRKYIPEYIPEE